MNHGLKLTPEMIVDLAKKYQQGKTTTELAVEFKMSKATVSRALCKAGIDAERKDSLFSPTEIPDEDKANIILDFQAGLGFADLTRKYDYTYSVLSKLLETENLYTKKTVTKINDVTKTIQIGENNVRKILSNDEQILLCTEFTDGPCTKLELAVKYDIHPDTVAAILRRHATTIKRYMPDEVIDVMCNDYQSGTTVYKLSIVYNQPPQTIKYWLTKRGLGDTLDVDSSISPETTTSKTKLSKAQFRELAQSDTLETYEILLDIARDPQAGTRNRISAIALIHERAHGKPREEVEKEKDNQSAAEKILQLIKK